MPATLTSLQTDMFYRLRDVDRTAGILRIPTANYTAWINRGIRRIAQETLFKEAQGTLTGDGVNYGYALSGLTDFLGIRSVYFNDTVLEVMSYEQEILARVVADDMVVDDPTGYAIFNSKIWFNAIPSGTIYVAYYKYPTTLVQTTAETVDPPLDMFDSLILSAAMVEYGEDEGDTGIVVANEMIYKDRIQQFIRFNEQRGKHQLGSRVRFNRL